MPCSAPECGLRRPAFARSAQQTLERGLGDKGRKHTRTHSRTDSVNQIKSSSRTQQTGTHTHTPFASHTPSSSADPSRPSKIISIQHQGTGMGCCWLLCVLCERTPPLFMLSPTPDVKSIQPAGCGGSATRGARWRRAPQKHAATHTPTAEGASVLAQRARSSAGVPAKSQKEKHTATRRCPARRLLCPLPCLQPNCL